MQELIREPDGRLCKKCLTLKRADEFSPRSDGRLNHICKECRRRQCLSYRRNHIEEVRERSRCWKRDNRAQVLASGQRYRAANREQLRVRARAQYVATAEKRAIADRERRRSNPQKTLQYSRQWRLNNKEKIKRAEKRYYAANRKKKAAHSLVNYALRQGRLVPLENCVLCGRTPTQAHHPNYDLPLDIIWLCEECHKGFHRKYNPHQLGYAHAGIDS